MAGLVSNKLALVFLLGTICLSPGAYAKSINISDVRNEIRLSSRNLSRINSNIILLEKKLSKKNKNYIEVLDNKRKIESNIYTSSEKIEKYLSLIDEEKVRTKKVLGSVVANSMSNTETSSEILSKKIFTDVLKKRLIKLQSLENIVKIKKDKLAQMQKRFAAFEQKEGEILTFISELEERKKEYAAQYVSIEKNKLELATKLSSIKSQISQKKMAKSAKSEKPSLNIQFSAPIESYSGLDYQKKGITFKFKDSQVVKSTLAGVVNHVGTLANYGNVVMVDHGDGVRSIYLGDLSSKLKQGQKIKADQVIGQTRVRRSTGLGQIYFEVRKKNKAQNTFLLMDKKFLAKNNLNIVNI
ncbi:murein hydrolase activator EnvC [Halobacteriovorax sp. HLS]|uniref:murein hydrolase activator EnvC family protein n=1 Tax=Halobacteriovorax sp. HLS TaxID=2234000 RepID=UPI000FDAA71D|nr:M23 family metallopeptidase [Halobacteriovorax sp. HLS]